MEAETSGPVRERVTRAMCLCSVLESWRPCGLDVSPRLTRPSSGLRRGAVWRWGLWELLKVAEVTELV